MVSKKWMWQCMQNVERQTAHIPNPHNLWQYVQLETHSWNVLSKWRKEGWASLPDEDLRKVHPPINPLIKDTLHKHLRDIADLPTFIPHLKAWCSKREVKMGVFVEKAGLQGFPASPEGGSDIHQSRNSSLFPHKRMKEANRTTKQCKGTVWKIEWWKKKSPLKSKVERQKYEALFKSKQTRTWS